MTNGIIIKGIRYKVKHVSVFRHIGVDICSLCDLKRKCSYLQKDGNTVPCGMFSSTMRYAYFEKEEEL